MTRCTRWVEGNEDKIAGLLPPYEGESVVRLRLVNKLTKHSTFICNDMFSPVEEDTDNELCVLETHTVVGLYGQYLVISTRDELYYFSDTPIGEIV